MNRILLALALALSAAAPMTNEEIVRLVAAGTPESEILTAIADRPAAYDLGEDMLEELRLAGVPDGILKAMRARQEASNPAPPVQRPLRGRVRLAVRLMGSASLQAPTRASDALAERFRLGNDPEARTVRDLAVYLACVTPEHVPDQWRSKSPLGRDLAGTPRHEMLVFIAGDTPSGARPALTLPREIEAYVDDLEPHDLVLGVAARVGERWLTLATARRNGVKAAADAGPLSGRVEGGGVPFLFRVELGPAQSASETSLETPASSIVTP